VFTRAARGGEPGVAHHVADGEFGDALAEFLDDADSLVAGDERRFGLDRPVTVLGVQVGVAHPRCDQLDERLTRPGFRQFHILDVEVFAEDVHDCSLHGAHDSSLRVVAI